MSYHIRVLAGLLDSRAGSHGYHRELVRRLAARGHRVSVVCFKSVAEVLNFAETYEIPLAPFDRSRFLWRFAVLRQYWHCSNALRAKKLPEADVVIGGEHLFLKGHWKAFPTTPWIYLPHSLVVSEEINSYRLPSLMHYTTLWLYQSLQRWALNHADQTLRFTHRGCDALLRHYGNTVRPRFVVNPIGIETQAEIKKSVARPMRLLVVGRLVYGKRIDFAISALAKLQSLPWELDIVGDGNMREMLEKQVKELNLSGRIRFHGHQPDPSPYYRQADLLLFPSRSESLGIVLLEAMSYGICPLAFRSDGVHSSNVTEEIVEHGSTGLLATDDNDFLQQLASSLRQPNRLIPLGEMAHREVSARNSWDKHLEFYEQTFEQLLQTKRSGQQFLLPSRPS